ncbi:hypothetical protein ACJMK2_000248 [Sinanodonta woodiana]|uniref:TGF-beta family profile domain-containing protein n=1 Tax=Sinanodonta woodiana TaxID=1069815 RepID=A0ABD3XNN2_SINWO
MSSVRSVTWRMFLSLAFHINVYNVFCSESLVHKSLQNTIAEEPMSKTALQAMEQKMLTLLGLHRKPSPIRNNAMDNSAKLFMLGLYEKTRSGYEDGSPGVDEKSHLTFNSTLLPDIHEINGNDLIISFVNQGGQLPLRGDKIDVLFFNFSDVSSDATVTSAELKLYKERSSLSNQAIYLIEVFRMDPGIDTEDTRFEPEANLTVSEDYEGWLSMQITSIVSYWNVHRQENRGLYIRVTDVKTGLNVESATAGIVGDHGHENHQPFMIGFFKTSDEEHVWHSMPAREAQYVSPTELNVGADNSARKSARHKRENQKCQRKELYVDFTTLGWNSWIIAPAGYPAYYCSGECTFPLTDQVNPTLHATVQVVVSGINPEIPVPCCAPTKLSDNQLLYTDETGNVVKKMYKEMVVDSCGCL